MSAYELHQIARRFRPIGVNQQAAHFQCIDESARFALELLANGIDCELVNGWSDEFGIGHVAVNVDGTVWDWTMRQFFPDAALPTRLPLYTWKILFPETEVHATEAEVWEWAGYGERELFV